jgi:hypothetical protein
VQIAPGAVVEPHSATEAFPSAMSAAGAA